MTRFLALLATALFLAAPFSVAQAQTVNAVAVASCGTPPNSPVAGVSYPMTQDLTGVLCTTSTGGGGGAVTIADGADVTQGAKADSACGTDTGTCSLIAQVKRMNQSLSSLVTGLSASIPAGSNTIGNVIVTDGTNNAAVTAASTAATTSNRALVVAISPNPAPVCTGITPINQTSSTDLKTFTNTGRICSIVIVSASAQGVSLAYGTGSVCATGTAYLIGGSGGTVALAANGGFASVSDRTTIPLGATAQHLCLIQSGAGNVSGYITWSDAT